MKTSPRFFISLSLLASGCLPTAHFRDATEAFAGAAQRSSSSLQYGFDSAGELCRRRADLDFLSHRISGASAFMWGAEPLFYEWTAQANIKTAASGTWKDHCARLAEADELQRRTLALFGTYAQALSSLSTTGNYDARDVSSIVGNGADLASHLAHNANASATIRGFAGSLGTVLSQLSAQLGQSKSEEQITAVINAADPVIAKMIEAMSLYADATDEELRDYSDRLQGVLVAWEKGLAPAPVSSAVLATATPAPAPSAPTVTPRAKLVHKKRRLSRKALRAAKALAAATPAPVSPSAPTATPAPAATTPASISHAPAAAQAPIPDSAIAFYHFAVGADAQLRRFAQSQAQYHQLLNDLRAAHRELAAAASSDGVVDERLRRVLGLTSGVLSTINAMRAER